MPLMDPRRDPLLRYARELGFQITPGSRHWHCSHPSGGFAIVGFGRNRSWRREQNSRAALRRAARGSQG